MIHESMKSMKSELYFGKFLSDFSSVLIGFCAYITTAYDTTTTAKIVFQCSGIFNKTKLSKAVKTNSIAEANALTIELRFFKNNEVIMPAKELLTMIAITKICHRDMKLSRLKLDSNSEL